MAFDRSSRWAAALLLGIANAWVVAQPAPASAPASAVETPPRAWIAVPRIAGRITAADIGVVINTADPYSVAIGEYYVERRKLEPEQVLRVELPVRARLTAEEFEPLQQRISEHFGDRTQGLALAWTVPYAVQCQSITGVLALGFDPELCKQSCGRSQASPYFNSASRMPWRDHHLRPSMLLASRDVEQGRRLIDRGVASDRSLALRAAPPVNVVFVSTSDGARNVRARLFPPPGLLRPLGVNVDIEFTDALRDRDRLLLVQTGLTRVPYLDTLSWVDGALADHLTSVGGQLDGSSQMPALAWLESGATASYGTVSEPCNHLQKFPHPQVLLLHYLQGSSALEAYWKSVAWPAQGVFIGEPLAAPFAR
jgi:uncharacterized protein (TIGR03790 family)